MRILHFGGLPFVLGLLALAGCGAQPGAGSTGQPAAVSAVVVTALEGAQELGLPGSLSASLAYESATHLVVNIEAHGAQQLKGMLLNVAYDPSQLRPMTVEPGPALGDKRDILSLMAPAGAGKFQLGAVLVHPELQVGFSGDGTLAQVSFRKEPAPVVRTASTPPKSAASQLHDMAFLGVSQLAWSYALQGDYDQNGEVNIADLMPVGRHYKEVSPSGAGQPFPFASAASQIDGDGNGEINVADLTPIALNYGVDALGGFRVFKSIDPTDCPADPAAANGPGAVELTAVPVLPHDAANLASSTSERLSYQLPLSQALEDGYYWVRPYDAAGNPGIPSLLHPASVACPVELAPDAVPDSGSGLTADPYVMEDLQSYKFALRDGSGGTDLTQDPGTAFVVDPPAAGTFNGNELTITPFFAGDFSVGGTFNGLPIDGGGVVYCHSRVTPRQLVIDKDPNDANWTGVVGTGVDETNAYRLASPGFNDVDADANDEYDLLFTLQATWGVGGPVIPNADLDWDCFPPFAVGNPVDLTADPSAGTFRVWYLTSGYIFAQDPSNPVGTGRSNDLYIVAWNLLP